MIRCLALLLLFIPMLALPTINHAQQSIDTTAIDRHVHDQMDGSHIPGAAIAIVEGNQIRYAQGYGSAGTEPHMRTSLLAARHNAAQAEGRGPSVKVPALLTPRSRIDNRTVVRQCPVRWSRRD